MNLFEGFQYENLLPVRFKLENYMRIFKLLMFISWNRVRQIEMCFILKPKNTPARLCTKKFIMYYYEFQRIANYLNMRLIV